MNKHNKYLIEILKLNQEKRKIKELGYYGEIKTKLIDYDNELEQKRYVSKHNCFLDSKTLEKYLNLNDKIINENITKFQRNLTIKQIEKYKLNKSIFYFFKAKNKDGNYNLKKNEFEKYIRPYIDWDFLIENFYLDMNEKFVKKIFEEKKINKKQFDLIKKKRLLYFEANSNKKPELKNFVFINPLKKNDIKKIDDLNKKIKNIISKLPSSTFTNSGSTITQTGTDNDYSNLTGVDGITFTNKKSHNEYLMTDKKLRIEGTLNASKDGTIEKLRIVDSDSSYTFNNIEIADSGTFIIGTKKSNPNDYNYQNYIPAIQEDIGSVGFGVRNGIGAGLGFNPRFATLVVLNGGQFEIYGRVVNVGAWGTQATSTTIWDGAYLTKHSASYAYGNDLTITNSIYNSFSLVASSAYTELSNNKVIGTPFALSSATPNNIRITINGIKDLGTTELVSIGKSGGGVNADNSPIAEAVNLEKGTDQTYQVLSGRYWRAELKSEVELEVKDLSGNLISGATIWYKGKNGTENTTTTNNLGIANFTFLMAKISAENGVIGDYEFFTKNEDTTDDLIDIKIVKYDKQILEINDYSLRGEGINKINAILFEDDLVHQPDKSIVDAYSTIINANQFYDISKSNFVDSYNGESQTDITRTDNVIDLRNLNLNVDKTANLNYNKVGSTITIRSDSFLDRLKTTENINFINGSVVGNFFEDKTKANFSIRDIKDNTRIKITETVGSDINFLINEHFENDLNKLFITFTKSTQDIDIYFSYGGLLVRQLNEKGSDLIWSLLYSPQTARDLVKTDDSSINSAKAKATLTFVSNKITLRKKNSNTLLTLSELLTLINHFAVENDNQDFEKYVEVVNGTNIKFLFDIDFDMDITGSNLLELKSTQANNLLSISNIIKSSPIQAGSKKVIVVEQPANSWVYGIKKSDNSEYFAGNNSSTNTDFKFVGDINDTIIIGIKKLDKQLYRQEIDLSNVSVITPIISDNNSYYTAEPINDSDKTKLIAKYQNNKLDMIVENGAILTGNVLITKRLWDFSVTSLEGIKALTILGQDIYSFTQQSIKIDDTKVRIIAGTSVENNTNFWLNVVKQDNSVYQPPLVSNKKIQIIPALNINVVEVETLNQTADYVWENQKAKTLLDNQKIELESLNFLELININRDDPTITDSFTATEKRGYSFTDTPVSGATYMDIEVGDSFTQYLKNFSTPINPVTIFKTSITNIDNHNARIKVIFSMNNEDGYYERTKEINLGSGATYLFGFVPEFFGVNTTKKISAYRFTLYAFDREGDNEKTKIRINNVELYDEIIDLKNYSPQEISTNIERSDGLLDRVNTQIQGIEENVLDVFDTKISYKYTLSQPTSQGNTLIFPSSNVINWTSHYLVCKSGNNRVFAEIINFNPSTQTATLNKTIPALLQNTEIFILFDNSNKKYKSNIIEVQDIEVGSVDDFKYGGSVTNGGGIEENTLAKHLEPINEKLLKLDNINFQHKTEKHNFTRNSFDPFELAPNSTLASGITEPVVNNDNGFVEIRQNNINFTQLKRLRFTINNYDEADRNFIFSLELNGFKHKIDNAVRIGAGEDFVVIWEDFIDKFEAIENITKIWFGVGTADLGSDVFEKGTGVLFKDVEYDFVDKIILDEIKNKTDLIENKNDIATQVRTELTTELNEIGDIHKEIGTSDFYERFKYSKRSLLTISNSNQFETIGDFYNGELEFDTKTGQGTEPLKLHYDFTSARFLNKNVNVILQVANSLTEKQHSLQIKLYPNTSNNNGVVDLGEVRHLMKSHQDINFSFKIPDSNINTQFQRIEFLIWKDSKNNNKIDDLLFKSIEFSKSSKVFEVDFTKVLDKIDKNETLLETNKTKIENIDNDLEIVKIQTDKLTFDENNKLESNIGSQEVTLKADSQTKINTIQTDTQRVLKGLQENKVIYYDIDGTTEKEYNESYIVKFIDENNQVISHGYLLDKNGNKILLNSTNPAKQVNKKGDFTN